MGSHLERKWFQLTSFTLIFFLFFFPLYSCLRNQSKKRTMIVFLNRTFKVCNGPLSTMICFFLRPQLHPTFVPFFLILHFQSSSPESRWRTGTVPWGLTGTHADRQSRESRVRKTSALHWKVPVPSRSSSQLFRFGDMSFTQMACRKWKAVIKQFKDNSYTCKKNQVLVILFNFSTTIILLQTHLMYP